jgi:hypothetical protein
MGRPRSPWTKRSQTVAALIPRGILDPIPLNTRPAITPPQAGAAVEPTKPAMATIVEIRYSGLLPYTFAKGVMRREKTPENRMKTMVV